MDVSLIKQAAIFADLEDDELEHIAEICRVGQTAVCDVGSNRPVINLGTRHPNPAPTLCEPVGKNLPTRPTIRAGTPVSSGGNSIQLPSLE